ncbi:MAG: hypothetical protein IT392_05640 [Nitrospirae bacterium]|nr:hypothetical protein [Nitrospirota bacterium]
MLNLNRYSSSNPWLVNFSVRAFWVSADGPANSHSYAGCKVISGGALSGAPSRVRVRRSLRAPGMHSAIWPAAMLTS